MSKYLNLEMGKVEDKLEEGEEKGKEDHRGEECMKRISNEEDKKRKKKDK